MKKKLKKQPRVVDLVRVSQASARPPQSLQAAAAEQSVQRSKTCALCRKRASTTEVTVGAITVRICDPCSDPLMDLGTAANAISRLLLRWL